MRRTLLLSLVLVGTFAGIIFLLAFMSMGPAMASNMEDSGAKTVASGTGAVTADPDIGILKFLQAGYARPGGIYVYGIYYNNQGEGDAENVLITDTLPTQVTYASDTSGYPVTPGTGGEVVWDVGTLPANESDVIIVTVNVPSDIITGEGVIEENSVTIGTSTPGDPDPSDNESTIGPVDVWEDEVEIGLDIWANPEDPAQGQEFFYTLQVCNHRGAAAGPIWLTDTLPADMTFVDWRVDPWWQQFWVEESRSASELVLHAPGLPGDWCSHVELTFLLDEDVPIGTRLVNQAEVYAEGDVHPDNDEYIHRWAEVGHPRYDLWIDKSIHSSSLAPGGWINYYIDYSNQGNVTTTVRITETIPDGLSFDGAWWGGGTPNENQELPPPIVVDDLLIWELGEMAINQSLWFHIQMNISDTLVPGTLIENCATIGGGGADNTPDNNESCYGVNLNDHGPNLRVSKEGDWQGDSQLYYQIHFENLGDEPVSNVWITDTLPISTTWNGNWSADWEGLAEPAYEGGQLLWFIGNMNPGETGGIDFIADLDSPGEPFRYFTNTVEITIPATDVNVGDNYDDDVAFSGGEVLWVDINVFGNYLSGEAREGPVSVNTETEEVTFEGGGFFDVNFENPFLPGNIVTVTAGAGIQPVVIQIPDPYEINADSNTGQVWGQIDHLDQEWLEVDLYGGPTLFTQTDGNGNYSVTFSEIPRGAEAEVRYRTSIEYADVTFRGRFRTQDLLMQVNYGHNWVEGDYEPGHTIWITVTDSVGAVKGTAELESGFVPWWGGNSGFSTNWHGWLGDQPDLMPGDWVYGEVDNGYTSTLKIGTIDTDLDLDLDTVEGQLSATWLLPSHVPVSCEIWDVEDGPDNIMVPDVSPNGGSFFCDFSGIYDILPQDTVSVRYTEPGGDQVINSFSGPSMRVNYAHDWAGGNYEAGHTFWITLTNELGAVKAVAEVETDQYSGWGGSGFETDNDDWQPNDPDIQVNNWVYFKSDDGYENAIKVGEISGTLDIAADSISGPIYASWFGSELLDVECQSWGPQGIPDKNSQAAADGSQPYECAWDEWDIQPGQDVGVMYLEPDDGDRIINVFADPAPEMRVWKWTEGSGQVAPGGPVVFFIEYENDGDAQADPVIMTDTLPANTSYVGDTSGVTPVEDGNTLTWDLGSLDPGERGQFELMLNNSASPGDTLLNQVDIMAPFNRENDEMHAEAEVQVIEGSPNLYINKQAQPNYPTPGETFLYEIDYGNEEAIASGPVVMTDTLPQGTTFVDWYSENDYGLWEVVSSDGKFVLEAPSIPGHWGDRIFLRLELDVAAELNTQLVNTVEITTTGDTDPGNNSYTDEDTWVNEPWSNGYVDKNFDRGVLVPGGEVEYYVYTRNNGNIKTQAWLTDTLPAGTTLEDWWAWDGHQEIQPPLSVDGQVLTWDLGQMEPGAWIDLGVRLRIAQHLQPDTMLDNCVSISYEGDGWPFDDESCVTDYLRDPGPNLRIYKYDWWESEERLAYDIRIENLGTESLASYWFTDTYPIQTNFEDEWWVQHGPEITLTHDADNNQLIFWTEGLDAGDTASIRFNVSVDGEIAGMQGLAFTNTVEAPLAGDVHPMDNIYQATTYSGPDIYTRKWLADGKINPGEIVTYTIEFGNAGDWPWWTSPNARITDTLPTGMTFITATAPWDPDQPWYPEIMGNTLAWDWDAMCPNCRWQFDLAVRISDTVELGDIVVNKVEMYSEGDIEHDLENNMDEFAIWIGEYKVFVPLVIK